MNTIEKADSIKIGLHTAAASRKNYEANEIQKFSWIGNVCNKKNISDKEGAGIHQMDASI